MDSRRHGLPDPGMPDPAMPDAHMPDRPAPWSRSARDVAVVLWSSFLAACFATLLFFSQVDPVPLGDAMTPARSLSGLAGYGIGFFFFWLVALVGSTLSIYLVRTAGRPDDG